MVIASHWRETVVTTPATEVEKQHLRNLMVLVALAIAAALVAGGAEKSDIRSQKRGRAEWSVP